ncbi:mitochondrial pyruvate carrier 2-like isoform X3 [Mytilus galloprovincialis]|uniref:mitochondrial pyruvate carrier 2-like isoform X3 n=1 Tax=Mytilus galloprovincialis TaxID=29158 RepID=UPI003F7BB68D
MSAIYRGIISVADKFVPAKLAPFWNHPAGPKTIFFWAPSFKWGLVIAGIADIARPAEKLSPPQSTALAATGFIWARWCLIITPRIWALSLCNVFVGCTGFVQLYRIHNHRRSLAAQDAKVEK